MGSDRICPACKGRKTAVVITKGGHREQRPCPRCGGTGKDNPRTK